MKVGAGPLSVALGERLPAAEAVETGRVGVADREGSWPLPLADTVGVAQAVTVPELLLQKKALGVAVTEEEGVRLPARAALAVGGRGVAVAAPSGEALPPLATLPLLPEAAAEGLEVRLTAPPVGVAGPPEAVAAEALG